MHRESSVAKKWSLATVSRPGRAPAPLGRAVMLRRPPRDSWLPFPAASRYLDPYGRSAGHTVAIMRKTIGLACALSLVGFRTPDALVRRPWDRAGSGAAIRSVAATTGAVNPSIEAGAFASDGRHGWVAGAGGTIMATTDGGETWALQSTGIVASLHSVIFLPDGRRGWAVGDRGTILATDDGGGTWRRQTSGTSADLASVTFMSDGQHGWAVGGRGTVIATLNGGRKWTSQSVGAEPGIDTAAGYRQGWEGPAARNRPWS
jgi:hypothetical protein